MSRWPMKPLLQECSLAGRRVGAFTGTRPYASTGDVNRQTISPSLVVSFEDRPSRADLIADVGDVLFARMQGTDKVVLVTDEKSPFIWSTGFAALKPKEGMSSRWVEYWLTSPFFQERKNALCTGATQKAITNEAIGELTIPYPPIQEQKRIVRILDEADQLRRMRDKADKRTAELILSVFNDLLGDLTKEHTDWKVRKLEEICCAIVDCPHSTPTFINEKKGYACVRSSDIQNGRFDWSSTKYVDEEQYLQRLKGIAPKAGDVVFCREGARLGNAAIVPKDINICLGQRMMMFRTAPDIATPEFIWALLQSDMMQQKIAGLVGGSASPHLNIKDIKTMSVIVPPLHLQKAFTNHVVGIRDLENMQDASNQWLNSLFQSVLHRAFQGEL